MFKRFQMGVVVAATALFASLLGMPSANAAVTTTVISDATYPLALDVDAAGNVWIGYANGPMTPKGVAVVPAATGTLFGVAVTAGVETRIFDMDGIQGILMSPAGHLFVATGAGDLYVATTTNTTVFGVATTANTLTLLSNADHFRGGLAMDSAGNLFGGRMDWNGVAVLPVSTGMLYGINVVANTSSVLLNTPDWSGDVAIDSLDNLYIASWFGGAQGVYVLPKASGTLYGQTVTQDTLSLLVSAANTAGVDVDAADNIYFSRWSANEILVLTPVTRTVLGQAFTADTPAVLVGAPSNQGVAVASDASFLVTGAGRTRRVVAAAPPSITTVSPNSGLILGGSTVTITGSDLTGATSVTFGGVAATNVVVVDSGTMTATVPAGSPGSVDVQVTTSGGTATALNAYTYVSPAPRFPPGPPVDVVAVPTLQGATVSWSPPEDPGTDAITIYAVRAWPGGPVCQVSGTTTSCDVRGLDPRTDYYFTVVAMSSAGWGDASGPSNVITPLAPRAPSPPLAVVATPGDGVAMVTWLAPDDPGTSAISDYVVVSNPPDGSCVSASASCSVTGLTNGTSYTFTVRARSAAGESDASAASNAVVPQPDGITIDGSRSGRTVSVVGTAVGLAPGTAVEVWVRIGDAVEFSRGTANVIVQPGGGLDWSRRVSPRKQIEVYFAAGQLTSNVLTLSGRPSR